MGETEQPKHNVPASKKKNDHPRVIVVRGWKDYLAESLLIIFSVLLALILTEVINKMHENQQTKQLLQDIRSELIKNKTFVEEQYMYHKHVLKNIDSALTDSRFQQQIVSNAEFNIHLIAPEGVRYRVLSDVAWQIAKQHDIASKIDLQDISLLTYIYQDQGQIMKSEDEVAKVFLDRPSRNPANIRETLILMRDNYHGWAVDRVPGLLLQYQKAIDKLK